MTDGIASIGTGQLGRVVVARLAPGNDLLGSLGEIARREGIEAGVILSGAASLSRAVLRNVRRLPPELPITDGDRVFVRKDGAIELLALSGNIAEQNGEVSIHAHITISVGEQDGLAYGGHLVPGCVVFSLAEIVIAEVRGLEMVRGYDEATRGPQLFLRPEAAG